MYAKHKKYLPSTKNQIVYACKIDGESVNVKKYEVKQYIEDPEFQKAYMLYERTKRWGLPNGNVGWYNESATAMDAIDALETEARILENEEMKKAQTKGR